MVRYKNRGHRCYLNHCNITAEQLGRKNNDRKEEGNRLFDLSL